LCVCLLIFSGWYYIHRNKLNVSNQGGVIVTPDKSGRYMVSLAGGSNIANNTVMNETICICFYDLTQMFGSTIADYVYNLEQTTRGAGLAWFRRYFPKEYYSYDSGSLQSVNTSAHRTNGFNQWDEQWESGYFSSTGVASASSTAIRSKNFIKCLPNTTYYGQIGYSGASLFVCWYDSSQTFISRQDIRKTTNTSPANAQYFKICTGTNYTATYQNDICINLHWDGERDGEYEAYVEHTYPLGNVELRGIPKLDANNELYYDGDTYESDGTVTRRFGIVDLGSLTYTANSHQTLGDYFYASVGNLGIKYVGAFATTKYDTVTPKYSYTKRNSTDFIDKTFTFDGSTGSVTQIQFKDSAYSDASTFKTSLSGIYLLYELATPTTESADAFQNPQIVDDWGTEEYVDRPSTAGTPTRDVAIPVGHDSMYQANLRAKLEMAPDSPSDGNGDYVVRQTDGINEYVKLVIPTELPSNPSEDGTYILKATVSGGTTTLSWEVQS